MFNNLKKILITGFIVSFIFSFVSITISVAQYHIGDTVSDFTLNDVDGNSVSLYDYQGKVILLNFFATW